MADGTSPLMTMHHGCLMASHRISSAVSTSSGRPWMKCCAGLFGVEQRLGLEHTAHSVHIEEH